MATLTDKFIRALKPTGKRAEYSDAACKGLVLRLSANGDRTFSLLTRARGKLYRVTLGRYDGNLTLGEARRRADAERRRIQDGITPPKAKLPRTVKELIDAHLVHFTGREKVTQGSKRNERSLLGFPGVPNGTHHEFFATKLRDVTELEVETFLKPLVAAHPTTANRTLSALRRAFGHGVKLRCFPTNPLDQAAPFTVEESREHTATSEEIAKLWHGLDKPTCPIPPLIGLALKLTLITAQRVGQIVSLEEAELSIFEGQAIATWPAAKMKGGKKFKLPLTFTALGLINDARIEANRLRLLRADSNKYPRPQAMSETYIFPSTRNGGHIEVTTVSRAMATLSTWVGIEDKRKATVHDLRRTAASIAANADASMTETPQSLENLVGSTHPLEYIDRTLAHSIRGVTAVYARGDFLAQKLAVLKTVEARVLYALQRYPQ